MMPRSRFLLAAVSLLIPGTAMAQTAPYDRCMTEAADKASYGTVRDEEIYRLARIACTDVRASVIAGHEGDRAYMAALDAADAEKAKNFPSWIKGVRERRRLREAQAQTAKP
ncbi:MAG TPA: hypothetical protein VF503_31035 [Sphingobium sp.]|uniref:hypothetical protein n=1 Tax=Sphingobium sp. TaxID=1912891 RepID=UPI002ED5AA40